MDLRSWLQETAGLSGRALVVTTKACEDNFIESLADLRLAQSQPTEMDKIFPQGLIRLKISAALEDDGAVDDESNNPSSQRKTKLTRERAGKERQPAEIRSGLELPEGKR